MKVSNKQLTNALASTCDKLSGKSLDEAARGFVELLAKRGELGRVRDVIRRLTVTVVAETSHPLKPAMRKSIQDAAGGPLTEVVNKDLIGGVRLRIDDRVIDGTVAGQLERLQKILAD